MPNTHRRWTTSRTTCKPVNYLACLGPNGAGKSTTIGMLCGLIRPTSGEAKIGSHSIRTATLAAKRLIGIVPQEIALYPTLSARQNLHFWGQMYDMQGKALTNRVEEVLEQIGLRERADDRIDTYSGGMKRRVNIGAGLLHRPQVLFMDEPTVGIDPQSRRAILDMTKQLNAEGMTILYTTHYMEEAQELSHRIGIQDHGKLIALGTLPELTRLVGETDTLKLQVSELLDPAETEKFDLQLGQLPGVRQRDAPSRDAYPVRRQRQHPSARSDQLLQRRGRAHHCD